MRLINADALLAVGNVRKVTEYDEGGWGLTYHAVPETVIKNASTVDAVPVVRCAECRNAEHTLWSTGEMYCTIWKMNPRPTGYCYLGAKMDGGAADGSD